MVTVSLRRCSVRTMKLIWDEPEKVAYSHWHFQTQLQHVLDAFPGYAYSLFEYPLMGLLDPFSIVLIVLSLMIPPVAVILCSKLMKVFLLGEAARTTTAGKKLDASHEHPVQNISKAPRL